MDIKVKSGNQNIAATLIKPAGFNKPLTGLIFVHGWKSDKRGNVKRATEISKLGFVCLCIDLRGHGYSDGSIEDFSREDHVEDIKSAYKYLSELPEVNKNRIGIVGSSYGGYLSAVAVNFLEFEWLVLRVPALYYDKDMDVKTDKLIKENPQAFILSDLTPQNCLALKGVNNFNGEILIIESEEDKVIPHRVIENYLETISDKRKLTYEVMKGAPHSLETDTQENEYIGMLKNWLTEKSAELEIEL